MITVALGGKPNAGKSTFYTAATDDDVDVADYPFTTIDANRGVAYARTDCPCLDRESRCGDEHCHDGKRYVPVELYDVAGLVPGAHEGRGLGNQFLDELTGADVIVNVVDAAGGTNAAGEPVEVGEHDPLEDVDFVESELDAWLADIVERNWETVERRSRSPDFGLEDALRDVMTGFGATAADVTACLRAFEYPDDPKNWADDDRARLAREVRERTKPVVVAANKVDVAPDDLVERLLGLDDPSVPATAQGELALRRGAERGVVDYNPGDEDFAVVGDVSAGQRETLTALRETMATYGGTGVQAALNHAVYDLLDRVTVYPVEDATKWTDGRGNVLPDAHLLPRASTPRDLAYAVHSDIGDGYVHAVDARSDRQVSDDYHLEEGDVIRVVSAAN